MRTLYTLLAVGLASSLAIAQTNPPSPYPMPGTAVGQPMLTPVGTPFPKVGAAVGAPVGYTGMNGQPVDLGQRPAGQLIDLTNLAAPLSAPLPPDLAGTQSTSYLGGLYAKWKAALGLAAPPTPPTNPWVPGIARRNREARRESPRARLAARLNELVVIR